MENKENPLKVKSYKFALRIVKLYKYLAEDKREFVLSKQVLRSGTSIGANVAEGSQAQSKADFVHKLSISLKESFETEYWICLYAIVNTFLKAKLNHFWKTVKNCKKC
jgi:four helix bundle protein